MDRRLFLKLTCLAAADMALVSVAAACGSRTDKPIESKPIAPPIAPKPAEKLESPATIIAAIEKHPLREQLKFTLLERDVTISNYLSQESPTNIDEHALKIAISYFETLGTLRDNGNPLSIFYDFDGKGVRVPISWISRSLRNKQIYLLDPSHALPSPTQENIKDGGYTLFDRPNNSSYSFVLNRLAQDYDPTIPRSISAANTLLYTEIAQSALQAGVPTNYGKYSSVAQELLANFWARAWAWKQSSPNASYPEYVNLMSQAKLPFADGKSYPAIVMSEADWNFIPYTGPAIKN